MIGSALGSWMRAQGRGCVSGLDARVLAQIMRGMGLSPTCHYNFPWI